MSPGRKTIRFIIWLGVVLLQLIMTQVVTLLVSLLAPDLENFQRTQPILFALLVGLSFSTGVFLTGWLALKLGWLKVEPRLPARLAATLSGAYLPLIVALIVYHFLDTGNPFFLVSILGSILGFYIPGWIELQ